MKTDLSTFNNSWYSTGASQLKRILWYATNICWFKSSWISSNRWKCFLLRLFGAQVGIGVVIKPSVNIKYPWKLKIGNHVWIGEEVWIDNLAEVKISDHVCISQGAMLLCGNHDYKSASFDLIVGEITLDQGAWIGARSIVGPGVTVGNHAVLGLGSVASSDLEEYTIYRGNPALPVKKREIVEK